MILCGVSYRVTDTRLNRAALAEPIPPGTLAPLPNQLGDWQGRDAPLDQAVLRAADVDDHLSRVYVNDRQAMAIGLFIAFGVRARDLTPHRPEICYPGAGWTLTEREVVSFVGDDGPWRATAYSFLPGKVDEQPLIVLNFYVVDDQVCEDVSMLRSRAAQGQVGIRYMAQVQITARVEVVGAPTRARAAATSFAEELIGPLRALLREARPNDEAGVSR